MTDPTPSPSAPPAKPAAAPAPEAAPHDFAEIKNGHATGGEAHLSVLYDLDMPVSVELGRTSMSVRDLLHLSRGAVVQLDRLAGEPVDVFVGDRKLAEGEVVVLGEHFGVRLTRVIAGAAAGMGPA
ncbi:MAG: flagellar motor switch protein FliN [Gemmatimonadota bacterium]|nr:flagellar motor switch protein FliN [Gemmatimonadota bacterium]